MENHLIGVVEEAAALADGQNHAAVLVAQQGVNGLHALNVLSDHADHDDDGHAKQHSPHAL